MARRLLEHAHRAIVHIHDHTRADDNAATRALFAVPPAAFVRERTAWIAKLRSAKQRAVVKGLHRPTVDAWLVNHVAQEMRAALTTIYRLGDAVVAAHSRLLRGGSLAKFQTEEHRLRAQISVVVTALAAYARSIGAATTQAHLDRVRDALFAAAIADRTTRATFASGTLERLPAPAEATFAPPPGMKFPRRTRPIALQKRAAAATQKRASAARAKAQRAERIQKAIVRLERELAGLAKRQQTIEREITKQRAALREDAS